MIEQEYEGYNIKIGTNANENDQLVKQSNPEDTWVHISEYPSAHGVIRNEKKGKMPKKVIKRACCLIKSKSRRCKSMKDLMFDVCLVKNVEMTDTPGLVSVRNVKHVYI